MVLGIDKINSYFNNQNVNFGNVTAVNPKIQAKEPVNTATPNYSQYDGGLKANYSQYDNYKSPVVKGSHLGNKLDLIS